MPEPLNIATQRLREREARVHWGRALRILRVSRDLSAKEAGTRLGLTSQQMARMESSRRMPDAERLEKIAKVYRVAAAWIAHLAEGRVVHMRLAGETGAEVNWPGWKDWL